MFKPTENPAKPNRWVFLCLLALWVTAYATPLIRPVRLDVVCSGSGMYLLAETSMTGSPERPLAETVDCPDCLPLLLPPATAAAQQQMVRVATPVSPLVVSGIPARPDLPPPARAPPSL